MRLRRKPWVDEAIHDFDDFVFPRISQQGRSKRAVGMRYLAVRLLCM